LKLVSYNFRGETRAAAVIAGRVVDVCAQGMLALLRGGRDALTLAASNAERAFRDKDARAHPLLEDVELIAPVPRPLKIVAVGRNYADHAAETGMKPLEAPRIIAKLPSSVIGPGAVVVRPEGIVKLDYECELAAVIGTPTKHVSVENALDSIAGYTILDDVSAREFQFDVSPPQTTFAKSMDGFCPMGPWLVTRDEIPDPQQLQLRTWVNDELVQDASTSEMTLSVATLVAYISRYMTLEPGDVIATGTPAGVGAFRKPPRWLQPGDRVKLEISRIGTLEHSIG
jgi:2-keto-4-pentenoate hydratase/2-oxohepta-3-ene-1,7-dioic acid hydratase in catechol pathway